MDVDAEEGKGLIKGGPQLLDKVGVDGECEQEDDENLGPVPQLAAQEAPPLAGGEEEDPLGPECGEENVKTDDDRRNKRKQPQPSDLVLISK